VDAKEVEQKRRWNRRGEPLSGGKPSVIGIGEFLECYHGVALVGRIIDRVNVLT